MLGFFNKFVVQWFGIRVFKVVEADKEVSAWGVMGPIAPLTGWNKGPWPNYWPDQKWRLSLHVWRKHVGKP